MLAVGDVSTNLLVVEQDGGVGHHVSRISLLFDSEFANEGLVEV